MKGGKKYNENSSSSDNIESPPRTSEVNLNNIQYLNKKVKPSTYDLNDKELKVVNINDDIKARLIANDNGYFIDIRKYYKGYPTKKGIRILATKFVTAADILKSDVEELFEKVKK